MERRCCRMPNYDPIPIYDDIVWDLTSEACHMLLLAPTGSGKTIFLNYLVASLLKQQHILYVVDAKMTSFGALYKNFGKSVSKVEEIIQMLEELVKNMEADYADKYSSDDVGISDNFKTFGYPAHVLIFDEVLSALGSGDKKQQAEMEKKLNQLCLRGRMAGYIVVLSAQRLLASDLPKSITEQCQTRIVLGANVSEETFHVATGYYKKDLATAYRGGNGKGYAITPTNGLTYIETPYLDLSGSNYVEFKELINTFKKGDTTNDTDS